MGPRTCIAALLALRPVRAFVSGSGSLGSVKPGLLRQHCCSTSPPQWNSQRQLLQRLSAADKASSTPSWRLEMDELIRAASPWGSAVETEILALDLLKVGTNIPPLVIRRRSVPCCRRIQYLHSLAGLRRGLVFDINDRECVGCSLPCYVGA